MIKFLNNLTFKYQYNVKLQKKFIISHLILAILPTLLVSVLLYSQFSNIMLSNAVHSEQSLSLQTKQMLEDTIEQIYNSSTSIIETSFIRNLSLYEDETNLSQVKTEETLDFLKQVSEITHESNISEIKIYVDEPLEKLLDDQKSSSQEIFMPIIDAKPSYWHGIFSSSNISHLVCPSLYLTPSEREQFGEFAIIHKIPYSRSTKPAIYVAVYFSQNTIDSILKENIQFTTSLTYLIDNRDTLVSSSDSILAGRYLFKYQEIPEYLNQISSFSSKTLGFEKVFVSYNRIQGTTWYMVSVIPENNILSEGRMAFLKILLVYIIFIIIIFYVALWLSSTIVKGIQSVIKQMAFVRNTTPKKLKVNYGDDEIGDLVNTYNFMVDRINNLLQEQDAAAQELRKSEFKALQSQINPHFLYNTLDMISWLSNKGDSEKVHTAVQLLSRFYKLTLNKGNTTVSLRDELDHVSHYVKLQNMRYEDKIHFIIDIPDELLGYEIPKLILQPIVENSVQHGIFGKESKEGVIVIMGWLENDKIVIVISDDGVGIPSDKLKNILKGQGNSSTGSNIAIYNTHKRLQLFYNQDFGLHYQNSEEEGTEVEIRIPANIKKKNKNVPDEL